MIKDYELKHLLKANIEDFAHDLLNGKTANGLAESLQTMNEIVDRFVDKYNPEPVKPVLPKEVVLTKEQAEIVERAHVKTFPATFIYNSNEKDEELLMNAYVNGYTVETEKKYNLILGTGTDGDTNALFKSNPCTNSVLLLDTDTYADDLKLDKLYQFTQEEIDKYNKDFWIKGIDLNDYKVEVEG